MGAPSAFDPEKLFIGLQTLVRPFSKALAKWAKRA
jgi:hypothetical protein